MSVRYSVSQERGRRLIPWRSVFGNDFRGGVAGYALAQSESFLHLLSCFDESCVLSIAKSELYSRVCHWGVDQLNFYALIIGVNDFG
jgi:hypothetical protein